MKTTWMLGACVTGLALASLGWYRLRAEKSTYGDVAPTSSGAGEQREDRRALEARLERLEQRAQLSALELKALARNGRSTKQKKSTDSSAAEQKALPDLTPRELELEKQRVMQRREYFGRALEHEPRDSAWAAEMESRLRALHETLFTGPLEGTVVENAECRATFCRLELEHVAAEVQRDAVARLFVSGIQQAAVYEVPRAEGEPWRTVAYLAAARLPELPEELRN